ncbi:MAG: hypothetical protein PHR26_02655 [Candidatus ainarchaeum sp.]|nr:hypothetical protein [Candidatus ainarchaeum sp.]MDD3975884.1 hypothetical protein [Candidatus ainarchaeum sp.]
MIKNKKAQISIEYIVFIAIFLMFFQAVLYPSAVFAENIINDVSSISQSSQSINSLSNSIESLANSSGYGKRTIFFYLPENTHMSIESNKIIYSIDISNQKPFPNNCSTGICTFEKILYIGSLSISEEDSDNFIGGYSGKLIIEKKDNGVISVKAD